ncbi:hypothetical protein [Haloferula sp. BvORR071]|uniref:hypothetical protein n=1 Tax=Haloferula sp. BvORR071 TaxID=1396141 RepID=UPI00054E9B41|nr:hypothetical protein [Haloferula sp. BvORR071]
MGKFFWGLIGIETRYVSFTPDSLAAVEMINAPPFFAEFAASIRHVDHEVGGSTLTYKLRFVAKPRCLRWLLHPIMLRLLRYETQKRLKALSDYLQRREWEAKTETARWVGDRWGQNGNIDSRDD